jgi:nucleotide-binding universal stress UspA family protein
MAWTGIEHIICAVRGGPASQETANSAIGLARDLGARLTFFHVVDPGCLDCGDLASSSAAYREYVEQAESMLYTLTARAQDRGVTQVDAMLREGNTRQELRNLAVGTDAEFLVLGYPRLDSDRSLFSPEEYSQFLAELDFGGELRTIQVKALEHDGP